MISFLPSSCEGCPLYERGCKSGTKFSKIEGKGTSGVMIIGEASGQEEDLEALPFRPHAPAGSILEKAIKLSGMRRSDFWITNIIRCRPPGNNLVGTDYERAAIDHCRQYLDQAVEQLKPRAILTLGAIPLREITGMAEGKRSITYVRGYPLQGNLGAGLPVIPSYHPAFIVRGNTRFLGLLVKDINSARSAAAGRLTYVVDPSTEMQAFEGVKALERLYDEAAKDPECWIAADIETPQSKEGEEDEIIEAESSVYAEPGQDGAEISGGEAEEGDSDMAPTEQMESSGDEEGDGDHNGMDGSRSPILSIQFAVSDRWGVFGDWNDPKIRELAQKIFKLSNPKVFHNGDHFDVPKLEEQDIVICGDIYDSLSMRRALQPDLKNNLQQVAGDYGWRWPWKHLAGTNDILYGVADVCALVKICSKLPLDLDKLGMWDGYQTYIRDIRAKVEIPWERRGIPINRDRLDRFREEITEAVETKFSEMLPLVPPELNSKNPEEGYKMPPEWIKEVLKEEHPDLFAPTLKTYKNGKTKEIKSKTKITDLYLKVTSSMEYEGTLEKLMLLNSNLRIGEFNGVHRLYEHVPFNPRSPKQMIAYLNFKGYEVPKTFREGKDTTADKLMKRLEKDTNDPMIALSREIRALEKMRDSYTGKIRKNGIASGGWIPDSDGRLRSSVMTNSTWQFSSKGGVNVFTLPKRRGDLANGFRKCVAAEPGHVMIEFDFKAFHDLTTASLANDEKKWRTAKLDPHSYVAGWLVKYPAIEKALDLSDNDLKLFLKEIKDKYKKVRDEQAKPLNHGTNFGQSYRRLYFENEEYFSSEAQAKQMLLLLRKIYPKTFQWQERLLESLDIGNGRVPYLQSVWGARRWFWHVWSWKRSKDGRWYKAKGEDAEKALAFLPSNHAHGMFRKKMGEMAELGLLEKYELVLFPHDALIFHPLAKFADECIETIKGIMESPVIELANPILCPDGFSCAVDVAIGPDMGSMSEVHF